ncbi:hypothetical protein Tco_1142759 [Tanacetum coccineum]
MKDVILLMVKSGDLCGLTSNKMRQLPLEPSHQEEFEGLVMNFIFDQDEKVCQLEEYMCVIGSDFMQLSSEVVKKLKEEIKVKKNKFIKIKKITMYTDIEDLEPLNGHEFSKDLTEKASFHTPKFVSPKEVPSFDEPEPQLLPNFSPLDVNLGDKRGTNPPIKPHSLDSSRMKVVDTLTIHTPPSPHVASFYTYCYYHPCINDPKKHYGFKPVVDAWTNRLTAVVTTVDGGPAEGAVDRRLDGVCVREQLKLPRGTTQVETRGALMMIVAGGGGGGMVSGDVDHR